MDDVCQGPAVKSGGRHQTLAVSPSLSFFPRPSTTSTSRTSTYNLHFSLPLPSLFCLLLTFSSFPSSLFPPSLTHPPPFSFPPSPPPPLSSSFLVSCLALFQYRFAPFFFTSSLSNPLPPSLLLSYPGQALPGAQGYYPPFSGLRRNM